MKLSPISFNLNNQVRNNKIQNQPRLKPMASDCVSFGATIPRSVIDNARNDIANHFFTKISIDAFLSLDKEGRQEVISASTEEQRKAVYNERDVATAIKKGKIKELLEIPQTDDELFELLKCQANKSIDVETRHVGSESGPLKNFLSFEEALMVLEKLKKIESKKQFLDDRWEYCVVRGNYCAEASQSMIGILGQEGSLDDKQKLNRILLEIIQDDSTSNNQAAKLISAYKYNVDPISSYYLSAIREHFKSQIEE
ncbi:hypothetical protein IJX73_04290 [bacterium]|nr:hypothetical protein [bacterium]